MNLPTFFRRHRAAPSRTTAVEVRILCRDGTVKTLTVHIPETTAVRDMLRVVAVQLLAQFEVTGKSYRIHSITQRTTHAKGAHMQLPVEAEGPIWPPTRTPAASVQPSR